MRKFVASPRITALIALSMLFPLLDMSEMCFSFLDEVVDTLGEGAFGKVVECIDHKA